MCMKQVLAVVGTLLMVTCGAQDGVHREQMHPELPKLVRNWAEKLGGELWHFGESVTRRNMAIESFRHTQIVIENGQTLVQDITERIKAMMDEKVAAVRRIMDVAENAAAAQGDDVDDSFDYYNAKDLINSAAPPENKSGTDKEDVQADTIRAEYYTADQDVVNYSQMLQPDDSEDYQQNQEEADPDDLERKADDEDDTIEDIEQEPMASLKPPEDKRRMPLYPNPHFYNISVNTNLSAVHVPSNVYDRSKEVIKGIKWSEQLDTMFRHNYKADPSLSWQFFGSSTGFMRQFPAMIWTQEPVDLYDCRMRSWYIQAASSPKDIVILIDRSGSMTGMRREIAKHVVNNILDTLGNNDYVNIYTFSNTTEPLIDCFDGLLVQANLANVRMFKDSMGTFRTEQIANFSLALTMAFRLLKDYREVRIGEGAQCNQAIMLVTDGVYYNFQEIFEEYNWQNRPLMPVRVFTYLIGREVSDVREVKWMACANRGYYVHLSTYAEVREQVLKYIPVMARPMVLNPMKKPNPAWSPIYADVTDPKLTNYLWVHRERDKQRERFVLYRRNRNRTMFFIDDGMDKKFLYQQRKRHDKEGEQQVYRLMTSVSLPVYDKRENANISEKIQINEKIWITVTRETRVANLLGVAGTDVPIEYIKRLMLPYRLGVNGYAFIVTNNGYILIHPDLRPTFQGILKPAYNRVDMIEIELLDDDTEPREFSEELKEFRKEVINQKAGQKEFRVKTHIDEMKRIMFGKRYYYYKGIQNTPFTVVVALPEKYGFYRIEHPIDEDPHRLRTNIKNFTKYFTGNWTVHPEWEFCRHADDKHEIQSADKELLYFLHRMEEPGWKWNPCDRKSVVKLVADAKQTDWFNNNISDTIKEDQGEEFIKRYGITVAFLATHSGLTRWQYFPQNMEDPNFHLVHNKAIDEVWYRRAVEQHYVQPRSFVYSVPFDAEYEDNEQEILVTASHAIFKEEKNRKAPAAVVGFQFYLTALQTFFRNTTDGCGELKNCKRTCSSNELDCLLLDDSGYVIVSYNRRKTGTFLGDFRPDIMEMLVEEGIYNRTKVYDYQATCFPNIPTGSPANKFRNPLAHFSELLRWVVSTIFYFVKASLANKSDESMYQEEEPIEGEEEQARAFEKDFDMRLLINKTQPEACDKEMYLYSLIYYNERNISTSGYNKTMSRNCSRPFLIQPVSSSNLVLLVINMLCREVPIEEELPSPNPIEVDYNMSRNCHIVHFNNFPRHNYMTCINRSTDEKDIKLCGLACSVATISRILFISTFLFRFF